MNDMHGMIFDIKRFAIHDGPGIRTTVFFKGCPMDCHWCHNPESRANEPQTTDKGELVGYETSINAVMKEIEKEILFYDESGGGVTFSGGESLMQPDFLLELLKRCHKKDIHTTLDTTGYCPSEIFTAIADNVDLFLYDIKIIDDNQHLLYTGVSNQTIKENLRTLNRLKKNVTIRFPVIPTITDSEDNIKSIAEFLTTLPNIRKLSLLPYHRTAEAKYKRLNISNRMTGIKTPGDKDMEKVKNLFEKYAPHIIINKE